MFGHLFLCCPFEVGSTVVELIMIYMHYIFMFERGLFAEQLGHLTVNINSAFTVRAMQVKTLVPGGQGTIEQLPVLMDIISKTCHPAMAGNCVFFTQFFPSGE